MFSRKTKHRKFRGRHSKRISEILDKRAAARRASLVKQNALDFAVFHAHTLHILTADVQNELRAGQDFIRGFIVRHSFNLAEIRRERRLYQMLAVARRTSLRNVRALGKQAVNLFQYAYYRFERVAVVIVVVRIENFSVFVKQNRLRRRRTRVNSKITSALMLRKLRRRDNRLRVALAERFKLLLVRKKRRKTLNLAELIAAKIARFFHKRVNRHFLRFVRQSAAHRHKQIRVFGNNYILRL